MFWQSASIQGVLRYFGVEFTARGVMKVVLALAAVFIFVAWLLQPAHKEPEARALVRERKLSWQVGAAFGAAAVCLCLGAFGGLCGRLVAIPVLYACAIWQGSRCG